LKLKLRKTNFGFLLGIEKTKYGVLLKNEKTGERKIPNCAPAKKNEGRRVFYRIGKNESDRVLLEKEKINEIK